MTVYLWRKTAESSMHGHGTSECRAILADADGRRTGASFMTSATTVLAKLVAKQNGRPSRVAYEEQSVSKSLLLTVFQTIIRQVGLDATSLIFMPPPM